jgi:hypothetical protein
VDGLGQVQIVAMPKGETPVDVFQAVDLVKNFLLPYGQLFAFMVLSTSQDGSFRAIAEFCNVNAAIVAVGGRRNSPVLNVSFMEDKGQCLDKWTALTDYPMAGSSPRDVIT